MSPDVLPGMDARPGGLAEQAPSAALDVVDALRAWRLSGALRALDLALARGLLGLDPAMPPSLGVATALLAHAEGLGHACLDLAWLRADPAGCLGWGAREVAAAAPVLHTLPGTAEQALAGWAGCRSVVTAADAARGTVAPLVLDEGRLYLSRLWHCEHRVAAQVRLRMPVADDPSWNPAEVAAWVDTLFAGARGPSEGQRQACAQVLRGRWTVLTGGPGTGKTFTAARMLSMLWAAHRGPMPLRVGLAAPTGKAAARLRQSIDSSLQGLRAQLAAAGAAGAIGAIGANDAIGAEGAEGAEVATPVRPTGREPGTRGAPPLCLPASFGPALTLHGLLGARPGTRRMARDAGHPLDLDVLLVDEASMVHLELMDALLAALPASCRVVLLGDRDQLASVEAGSVLADLCGAAPVHGTLLEAQAAGPARQGPAQHTVVLGHSHRFSGALADLATAVNAGDGVAALGMLRAPGARPGGKIAVCAADAVPGLAAAAGGNGSTGGYGAYLAALAGPRPSLRSAAFHTWVQELLDLFDRFRVLCALREGPAGVQGLNRAIEQHLAQRGWLPQHRAPWYEGRPVMVTRNDPSLGLYNGDIGLVLRSAAPATGDGPAESVGLRAWFSGTEGLRSVAVNRLADVETAFAMTVHKSQGSEYGHVALVLPDRDSAVLSRELLYTGITRAREALSVVMPSAAVWVQAVARRTRRASGLARQLARGELLGD